MEPQQLATKVTQLESRVATLEDEGKIIKGEVKQILTEIRSAILVRENPFESENARGGMAVGGPTHVVSAASQPAKVELVMPAAPEPPTVEPPEPAHIPAPQPQRYEEPPKEPVMLRPQTYAPPAPHEAEKPHWSLLTIAGLSAWAEDGMRKLGSLRLEILLDLCEAAGHLTPEARTALSRVTELEIAEPEQAPSTNETVVILRQLEALVNDEQEYVSQLQRHG